jgi:hypothetical protein
MLLAQQKMHCEESKLKSFDYPKIRTVLKTMQLPFLDK